MLIIFPDLAVVVGNPFAADFFDDLLQLFDFRDKSLYIRFRNNEIPIVTSLHVGILQ